MLRGATTLASAAVEVESEAAFVALSLREANADFFNSKQTRGSFAMNG